MKKLAELSMILMLCSCVALALGRAWQDQPPRETTEVQDIRAFEIQSENLYRVDLPAGEIRGFDVMFHGDHQQRYMTLPPGYTGFLFVGAGREATRIRDNSLEYHDSAVFVGPFNGPVEFRSMTVFGSKRKAIHAGLASKAQGDENGDGVVSPGEYKVIRAIQPNFQLRLNDVDIVAEVGIDGARPVWGLFTYQCDKLIQRSRLIWTEGVEHASYEHGWSRIGSTWIRVEVQGSGAENDKVRNDSQEIQWVDGARIVRKNCTYTGWYEPWSWRGGAGIVFQGTGAAYIWVQGCNFYGGPGTDLRCLMIDDGGFRIDGRNDYYDAITGTIGGRFANGWVVLKKILVTSGPGPDWYGPSLRIGNLRGPDHKISRGVFIEDSAVYGYRTMGQFSDSPLSITGCNTPEIRDFADAMGVNTDVEAQISGNPFVPFSAGADR